MIYIIVGIVIAILIIFVLVTYNGFIKISNKVNEAFSTMDVYLKKRWDLIPNLIETVKGYTEHEKDTFIELVDLRTGKNYENMSNEEKINTNVKVAKDIPMIMALAENYPDLKASQNFMNLSDQLTKIEDEIANSRKYYNGTVRDYNNKIEVFPNNCIAKLFRYKEKKMFSINDSERENVKVDL